MKTDRHSHTSATAGMKHAGYASAKATLDVIYRSITWCLLLCFLGSADASAASPGDDGTSSAPHDVADTPPVSQTRAVGLLNQVIWQLAHGPAFIAKVRETVWATGREVVGVGTYEQAGGGSGRFNLQITMHDGKGKHQFQQISDGRLAWTRTDISGNVALRRVDVGRLDEWVRQTPGPGEVATRLKIGAWTEMFDTVLRDYVIRVDAATLQGNPVWVITGTLREEVRSKTLAESGRQQWPTLCPTQVRIAINAKQDPQTGFGQLLPTRIEFWSDPIAVDPATEPTRRAEGRLITLIELYSHRPITPPPIERFRFDNQDAEVNFINETERYIERFGVELTASDRRTLRR